MQLPNPSADITFYAVSLRKTTTGSAVTPYSAQWVHELVDMVSLTSGAGLFLSAMPPVALLRLLVLSLMSTVHILR